MGFEFKIPARVEEELREAGWDGVSPIAPEGEQQELDLSAPLSNPDADLDRLFGPVTPAVAVYPRTGTDRRQALDFIAGRDGAEVGEVAAHLGLSVEKTGARLAEMVTDGWVEQVGAEFTLTVAARQDLAA